MEFKFYNKTQNFHDFIVTISVQQHGAQVKFFNLNVFVGKVIYVSQ